jgi:hypothetical protein
MRYNYLSMTAYTLHPRQSTPTNQAVATNVAEGKARYKAFLAEIERRRRENYKRFLEKRRKLAIEASEVLY